MLYIYSVSGRTQWEVTCFCSRTVQARDPRPTEGPYIHQSRDHESGTLSQERDWPVSLAFWKWIIVSSNGQ